MIFFKSCPKCRGDLYQDRDVYGVYLKCVQCAFTRETADRGETATADPLTHHHRGAILNS